jgi:hypothetical protein
VDGHVTSGERFGGGDVSVGAGGRKHLRELAGSRVQLKIFPLYDGELPWQQQLQRVPQSNGDNDQTKRQGDAGEREQAATPVAAEATDDHAPPHRRSAGQEPDGRAGG